MKVHLIATGGAVMHNLALALHQKGMKVTGSDDEIFDPARTRLEKAGLLPDQWGWFPEKISTETDVVILGMHARKDNPELLRAQELGIPVYSFPEYLYENCREKIRVVIGGSHGKTTITSMVMHVLKDAGIDFDYMVGSQIEGFETMVRLSDTARIAVFEGDEYLSSPIDPRPKFHLYKPHIALLTGIAWDHINVFPTFDGYVDQFRIFSGLIEEEGHLIWYAGDPLLKEIAGKMKKGITSHPYDLHPYRTENGDTHLTSTHGEIPIGIFGRHNLQNISGARQVCRLLGVDDPIFYPSISRFKGAAKRLQLIRSGSDTDIYLDFAHAPSKLKATVEAVKERFPSRKLIACMELHTFSSLNRNFLSEYAGCMAPADQSIVYFDRHVLEHKKLPEISPEEVRTAFGTSNVTVLNHPDQIRQFLYRLDLTGSTLLLMSSGNFSGIDFNELASKLIP
jgi:UDP-N-acetylmuramate: L-alanyl-gamma-D-glutamyl-meso-diaminopimelate ligase